MVYGVLYLGLKKIIYKIFHFYQVVRIVNRWVGWYETFEPIIIIFLISFI